MPHPHPRDQQTLLPLAYHWQSKSQTCDPIMSLEREEWAEISVITLITGISRTSFLRTNCSQKSPRSFILIDFWSVCNICHPDIFRCGGILGQALLGIKCRSAMLWLFVYCFFMSLFFSPENIISLPVLVQRPFLSLKSLKIFFDQILKFFLANNLVLDN